MLCTFLPLLPSVRLGQADGRRVNKLLEFVPKCPGSLILISPIQEQFSSFLIGKEELVKQKLYN